MKHALITGITGMVGSHLADYLIKHTDWFIYGMVRWRSPMDNIRHLTSRINYKDRIELVYGELNDSVSLQSIVSKTKPDYIFHLAAQSNPMTSFDAPIDTLNTNILGTSRLLEAVRCEGMSPIIHVCASSEVFGRVPPDKVPISEECNFHPASPYAISKIGTDLIGRYYAEAYGMMIMTTRMFTHTGPRRGDVFVESTFAKQIALAEAKLIPPIIRTGNLNSLRTWADVRDAVRAYYMLVTVNPIPGEYYNIGGDYSCTVKEMLDILLNHSTRKDFEIVFEAERFRPIDADLQVPDTSKFTLHTGWKPRISFETTMIDLLNYWRDSVKEHGIFLTR